MAVLLTTPAGAAWVIVGFGHAVAYSSVGRAGTYSTALSFAWD
jgi:hypothetical protein